MSGLKMAIVWNDLGLVTEGPFGDDPGLKWICMQSSANCSSKIFVGLGIHILRSASYLLSISRVGVFVESIRWTQGFLIIPVHLTLDPTPLEILRRCHQI